MATVINARDAQLQASQTRVAGWRLAGEYTVDQSMVDGLGLVVENTRQVWLAASSQVFQIPKDGSISPSQIVLTANIRNITGTASLTTVQAGAITGKTVELAGDKTFSFSEANMVNDIVTFRLTAVNSSDNKVYQDEITIVKVREGSDAIAGYLTNENHTLPADSLGNVTNYSGLTGTFKVFKGATDITSACTFSTVNNTSGLKNGAATELFSATQIGQYTATTGYPVGSDVVTVTLRATAGSLVLDKILTVAKAKAGAAGAKGNDGTIGVRGSKTFYVAVTGSTNTFSDALATTTATIEGGPVLNDVVTQYNDTVGWSQTKFLSNISGSTYTWSVVNAVVDGNLLVKGSVGTQHLAANSVTADKMVIRGTQGNCLNVDRNGDDPTAWRFGDHGAITSFMDVAWGLHGTRVLAAQGAGKSADAWPLVPVAPGKKYRVSGLIRRTSLAPGSHIRVVYGTSPTTAVGQAVAGIENVLPVGDIWTRYAGDWVCPEGVSYANVRVILNWGGSEEIHQAFAQDLRFEEYADKALVVNGGIVADQIDTRGLTVKDAAGNVILGSGTGLNPAYNAFGQNLIPNSDCARMTWGASYNPGHVIDRELQHADNIFPQSANSYSLNGGSTRNVTIHQANRLPPSSGQTEAMADAYVAADVYPLGPTWSRPYSVQVIPGQKYCFSAYMQAHRCYVGMGIYFLDVNDNFAGIAENYGIQPTDGGSAHSLSTMIRYHVVGTAPANATHCRVYLRKYNTMQGQTESWWWGAAPMLEMIGSAVNSPSPYVPGSITGTAQIIDSAGLGTTATWNGVSGNKPRQFVVQALGYNATTSPRAIGLWEGGVAHLRGDAYWWNIAIMRKSDGVITDFNFRHPTGQVHSDQTLADWINSVDQNHLVIVWTNDHPSGHMPSANLITALCNVGASRAKLGSAAFANCIRGSYILVGSGRAGHGNGLETMNLAESSWCEQAFTLKDSLVTGGGAGDWSIDGSNASTFIRDAWIGQAIVDGTLKSSNYDANNGWAITKGGDAVFRNVHARGNIQATSLSIAPGGANRVEMDANGIRVYNDWTLRVKIGNLS